MKILPINLTGVIMNSDKQRLYFTTIKKDRYFRAAFETLPEMFLMDYFELQGDPKDYIWLRNSDTSGQYIEFKRKKKGNLYFLQGSDMTRRTNEQIELDEDFTCSNRKCKAKLEGSFWYTAYHRLAVKDGISDKPFCEKCFYEKESKYVAIGVRNVK